MQVQIDGEVVEVPERLADVVRWLVMEVAPLVATRRGPAKLVVNLGLPGTAPKTVLELHSG